MASVGGVAIGDHDRRRPAETGVGAGTAELVGIEDHTGELGHHRRPAHEGVGVVGHHDLVRQAEEEGRSGDGRAVDDEHDRHDARAVGDGPGGLAPAVQGGHALDDVGARRADVADQRHPLLRGRAGRLGQRVAGRRRQGTPVDLGLHVDHHHVTVPEPLHPRADGAGSPRPQRQRHGPETTTAGGLGNPKVPRGHQSRERPALPALAPRRRRRHRWGWFGGGRFPSPSETTERERPRLGEAGPLNLEPDEWGTRLVALVEAGHGGCSRIDLLVKVCTSSEDLSSSPDR